MYQLTIGEKNYLIENPHWIMQLDAKVKKLIINATEGNAMGIRYNDTDYHIAGKPEIDGLETVSLTYLPDVTEPPLTLEGLQALKYAEFDGKCGEAIVYGTDIETSLGLKHFGFSIEAQNNIKDAKDTIRDVENGYLPETIIADGIPFKASDGQCLFYTKDDILLIDLYKKAWILYHRTYLTALIAWCGTMTYAELIKTNYGATLPKEYKKHVDEVMNPINSLMNEHGGQ